ncbi:MAG: ABC transporter ATP-binding protein [Oscillospiraceae bacterium]|nr:ABC transporter ATP-binding protein [Oscillospiraceae bacterium]
MLTRFLKKHGWRYIPGFVFLLVSSYITTLAPIALGRAIDAMDMDVALISQHQVYRQALYIILIAVGVFVTRYTWRYFIIGNSRYLENFLREELFVKLENLPISYLSKQRSGDLMAYAVNDVGAVRMTFGQVVAMSVSGLSTAVMAVYSMVTQVDPQLTLLALLPVPVAVFIILKLGGIVRRKFRHVQSLFSELSGEVNETIMGVQVIKSFAKEEERLDEFSDISKMMYDANVNLADTSSMIWPSISVVFGLCYAIGLIVGGHMVLSGRLTLGALVTFNGSLLLVQQPVMSLGRIINMLQRGLASYKRLQIILEQPGIPEEEMQDAKAPVESDVEVRHLTFRYPGTENNALNDISLHLSRGATLGVVGPTGSGKTTLMHLLLKMYDVPVGSIYLGSTDITKIPAKTVRERAGFVPQDGFLFSASIRDNIKFYQPGATDEDMIRAARLASVHDDIAAFPDGYDTQVGERGTHLSGGQKQRIALARALIRDPQLLILDDTLSAVDNQTEQQILSHLADYYNGKTTVIVSHRLSAVRHAQEILFIKDGQIAERGTHEQLMAQGGLYARMYYRQAEGGDCDEKE